MGKHLNKGVGRHVKTIGTIILIQAVAGILILLRKEHISPVVPLYFGQPSGDAQVAPQIALLIPTGISFAATILGIIISSIYNDEFLNKIILGTIIALTILSTITTFNIIALVGTIF